MDKAQSNQKVIELAQQGLSYDEIAEVFGITRQRVSQICLKNDIVRRRKNVNPNKWEESWQEIREQKLREI